jgi:hypothetical protein
VWSAAAGRMLLLLLLPCLVPALATRCTHPVLQHQQCCVCPAGVFGWALEAMQVVVLGFPGCCSDPPAHATCDTHTLLCRLRGGGLGALGQLLVTSCVPPACTHTAAGCCLRHVVTRQVSANGCTVNL